MSDTTRHVDLVANRWWSGVQQRVCIVSADGSVHRTACASERPDYETVVADALDAHPERTVLDAVHRVVQGTYLFATKPHELDDCPFHGDDEIPMVNERCPACWGDGVVGSCCEVCGGTGLRSDTEDGER